MAFEYISPDDLLQNYNDAKRFMRPLHDPFDEYERIARNRPHPGIDKNLPRVTDGTLASIIQEKPKRIIQQIPTGKIECEDDWLEIVAQFILDNEIQPNAEEEAELIQKCWAVVSKGMTYGAQPAFVKFINRGEYFGTDFVLPYTKDVLLEPGKISDRASNVIMLRTWWTKNQIQALIAKEKKLSASAVDRGDEYEGSWDVPALEEMIEIKPGQKDNQSQTANERNKQLNSGFYEIVHVFQRGIGANFYSFNPKAPEDNNGILRTRKNPDPRGIIPIHYFYADEDLSNPMGRGVVEMSGGVQNLLDSEYQMYQYNRALLLNPPMKKRGNWSKANAKFVPNHIIELGTDTNADLEPLQIDNQALTNFPTNVSLMKSQIYNLTSSQDNSISAEAGDPNYSKTQAGVKAQDARLGVSDNHMRKQFESWYGTVAETELNLWFAERSGVQELTVDDKTAYKLKQIRPDAVSEDNKIRVDYDSDTPILKFKVDASSSDMEETTQQLAALDGLLERYEKAPILQQIVPPEKLVSVWNSIISASGVQDPENLSIEVGPDGQMKQDPNTQQQPPQMTPEMVQQMIQQGIQESKATDPNEHPMIKLMTSLNIKFTDLDSDTQRKLIQEIFGIQSDAPLPSEVTQATQVADTHLKADQQAHQQVLDTAKLGQEQNNQLHDQSVKMLEMAHTQDQQAQDNQMSQDQFSHTVDQADKSHELAKKAANKPVGAAK